MSHICCKQFVLPLQFTAAAFEVEFELVLCVIVRHVLCCMLLLTQKRCKFTPVLISMLCS